MRRGKKRKMGRKNPHSNRAPCHDIHLVYKIMERSTETVRAYLLSEHCG